MIKVKVEEKRILLSGHANYADYGKDIVCAAVSSIVICSIEGITLINSKALEIEEKENLLIINIISNDEITNKLINNMLNCLKELTKKYNKNIKIIDREE